MSYSIDEKIVNEALANFGELFDDASNENRKVLIRSLIKKIKMEPDRKDIKRIVFWFLEDNAISLSNALPVNEARRTIPQLNEVFSKRVISPSRSRYKSVLPS